jgi:prepilin-type N-terminal cleavage/methylation domain-containing protein
MPMKQIRPHHISSDRCGHQFGFTLIELMIAISVLGIGMLGAMGLMMLGMQTNTRSKTDTTATVLDQEVIEFYSTLKAYPTGTFVTINDCGLVGANGHEADLTQGAGPAGAGATLYTAATAPTTQQIGDINWTVAAPTLATTATPGYAMDYTTCGGDVYEVRWNVMNMNPAAPPVGSTNRLSLLTVSARPRSAVIATAAGAQNRAVLFAVPVTLRSMIEF